MHFLPVESIIEYAFYVINVFMKKVFKQLWQLIFKHRKKLIYGAFAFLISQIFFFNLGWIWIENEVFAEENKPTQNVSFEAKAAENFQKFALIQKIIYLLIYPMLVVAGNLVDNSLVYWEVFGFDVALRELWNIMRNLANFTLWFIFVYYLFKYIIPGTKKEDVKKLLISLLIAGLWIQASWFIMAALIDVSTILAYWIWWLPISVLKDTGLIGWDNKPEDKDNNAKNNPYILKTVINVDVDNIDIAQIYLTNTPWEEHYISECETITYEKKDLLLAPKTIYFEKKQGSGSTFIETESGRCQYGGQVYQFGGRIYTWPGKCNDKEDCEKKQGEYIAALSSIKNDLSSKGKAEIIWYIEGAELLEQWNAHVTWGVWWGLWTGVYNETGVWLDVNNEIIGSKRETERLNDILSGGSYVWIFTQLYSSLINVWQWIITKAWWEFSALLSIAISLWHLIAIAIPLIVVGIVFMIRVWILWIAIVISPFIALFTAFQDLWEKIKKNIKFLDYFSWENLLGIIFAPALICLAISLSTVLVTIITNLDYHPWEGENEILWWLVNLDIEWVSAVMRRFVMAIFWIAITRFLVWTAVESSKLWKMWFVKSLKNLAETSLWALPIIPIPWKEGEWVKFAWVSTVFGTDGQGWMLSRISDKIQTEYNSKNNQAMDEFINRWNAAEDAAEARTSSYKSRLTNLSVEDIKNSDRTQKNIYIWEKGNTPITFNQLNEEGKKKVIDGINEISDVKKREAFGQIGAITIKEWDKNVVYKFEKKDKDWKDLYKYLPEWD